MFMHALGLSLLLWPSTLQASASLEPSPMPNPRTTEAIRLMHEFALRTGLDAGGPVHRYLWTDAFAVCNYLGLARVTGEQRFNDLALRLVDQVHHTLGQHRLDDSRAGWISGLSGQEAEAHPTRGGLRIGKPLPERRPEEPFDERQEWERDGQYFHYLTKWIHALDQVSRATGEPRFRHWARELADVAHRAFTYQESVSQPPRMVWKMSIDLTRPLVHSMGQHDPLEGYITLLQLRRSAEAPSAMAGPDLTAAEHKYAAMAHQGEWTSPDPLGIGGLLVDAYRVAQLTHQGIATDPAILPRLLSAAHAGLQYYASSGELQAPAAYRLGFRELGLVIGLAAVERLWAASPANHPGRESSERAQLQALRDYGHLGEKILSYWRDPAHRNTETWHEHRDINEVMLATALAPAGFLELDWHSIKPTYPR
jgi:hypothetical protein